MRMCSKAEQCSVSMVQLLVLILGERTEEVPSSINVLLEKLQHNETWLSTYQHLSHTHRILLYTHLLSCSLVSLKDRRRPIGSLVSVLTHGWMACPMQCRAHPLGGTQFMFPDQLSLGSFQEGCDSQHVRGKNQLGKISCCWSWLVGVVVDPERV